MSLYKWFGFISDNNTGATTGVIGPLTADLNANGFNIINVGLLSAGDISTGGLTVNNCVTGPAGILKVCDQLDVENLANVGSLNVETTSTLVGDVDVQSTMHMPAAEPVGTLNLFSVTNINGSGPPTSTPAVGALAFTDVDGILWVYDGTVWKDVITSTPQDLAATLTIGNTTGANNIVVNSGQQLTYSAGARIGIGGATTGTTSATGINIGNSSTVSNGIDTIAIGRQASTSTAGSISIGERSSSMGGVSIGSVSIAGPQAVCIGQQATTGTGSANTVVGHLARLGDASNNCVALGSNLVSANNCSNTILIGPQAGTGASATANMVSIGVQQNVQGSQTVKIGRGLAGTGGNNSAVGDSIVLQGTANNCSVLGSNTTIPTGVTGATVLGAGAISRADGSVALGQNSLVDTTHTGSVAILGSTTSSNQIRLGVNHVVSVPGSVVLNSSIPTTATNNFLVLSKMLGIPTGAADSGAMTFDATNNVFYGRTGSAWVPFQTGTPTVPPLATVLTAGNTTSGTNINVSGTDRVDFTSGMKLLGTNVLDLNNNTVMGIINAPAATGQVFVGLSTSATTANIVATTPLANGILNLESKGSGQIQLTASTNSRVYTPTYLISDLQESAGLQNAVTQNIAPGAPTTRIITGTQIYNFSVGNAFLMADVVNNRMNLRPNALYTVTSNFRYQEGTNHTNNVDLTFVMTYFDGTTANIIFRDTKSYPVAGPGSNGGYVQLSQLVKTNAAAVQWVALDLITNSSNGSLLISELRFQISKVN